MAVDSVHDRWHLPSRPVARRLHLAYPTSPVAREVACTLPRSTVIHRWSRTSTSSSPRMEGQGYQPDVAAIAAYQRYQRQASGLEIDPRGGGGGQQVQGQLGDSESGRWHNSQRNALLLRRAAENSSQADEKRYFDYNSDDVENSLLTAANVLRSPQPKVALGYGQSNQPRASATRLFESGICQWPGCGQSCDSLGEFALHVETCHRPDERGIAQARVQMQMVAQLERQLDTERSRLQEMLAHMKDVSCRYSFQQQQQHQQQLQQHDSDVDDLEGSRSGSGDSYHSSELSALRSTAAKRPRLLVENASQPPMTPTQSRLSSESLGGYSFMASLGYDGVKVEGSHQRLAAAIPSPKQHLAPMPSSSLLPPARHQPQQLPFVSGNSPMENQFHSSGGLLSASLSWPNAVSSSSSSSTGGQNMDVMAAGGKYTMGSTSPRDSASQQQQQQLMGGGGGGKKQTQGKGQGHGGSCKKHNVGPGKGHTAGRSLVPSAEELEVNYKLYKDNDARPPYTYAALIRQAIIESSAKKLALNEIYEWFLRRFSYFQKNQPAWKNAIRHNLSIHKCFMREECSGAPYGAVWTVSDELFFGKHFTKYAGTNSLPSDVTSSGDAGGPDVTSTSEPDDDGTPAPPTANDSNQFLASTTTPSESRDAPAAENNTDTSAVMDEDGMCSNSAAALPSDTGATTTGTTDATAAAAPADADAAEAAATKEGVEDEDELYRKRAFSDTVYWHAKRQSLAVI